MIFNFVLFDGLIILHARNNLNYLEFDSDVLRGSMWIDPGFLLVIPECCKFDAAFDSIKSV